MFDLNECEHVPMLEKTEQEQQIERLAQDNAALLADNELLKGCVMELCEVLFAE